MYRFLISLFFLTVVILPSTAQPEEEDRTITLRAESIRVGKLLDEISRQVGVDFTYNSRVIDRREKITFRVTNATLEEAMNEVADQLQVEWELIEGQVVLTFGEPAPAEKLTISGFLSDQSSGENLISATVTVKGTNIGTFTNEFGYFALSLAPGIYTLIFSYVGYEPIERQVDLRTDRQEMIFLAPRSVELPQIIVDLPIDDLLEKRSLGELAFSPEELNTLPEFAGESGLVKGLQSLPGMQTHSDGSPFFYARGGERDQNLIVIDDAPIYNPSHLLGFYSIVIPDFAKQITVHKSDLPASMGDRLSSIVSIRTKDGNLNRVEFGGALNPLVNRLSFSAPLAKKKSALWLSVRRSNFEWLYRNNNEDAEILFWDFHLKWNWKINDKDRIYLTTIRGGDVLSSGGGAVEGIRWGNSAFTLRWNHIFGPKLFSNTILYTGNYAYNLTSGPTNWLSELGTLSLKTDFTNYVGPRYTARFGFEIQGYFTNPGRISLDPSVASLPSLSASYSRKGVLYYQGEWDISPKLKLNMGVRSINWQNLGPRIYFDYDEEYQPADTVLVGDGVYNQYYNIDPRLSLQYQIDSTSQLKLSFGRYHQFLNLIQNTISPFSSFEVWVPAGPNIRPQSSTQWELNYLKLFPRADMEFNAAAYYKRLRNQIDYEPHAATYLNPFLEGELRFGDGEAYGLELLLKKDFGKLNGWISYSYARVFRQTPEINNGQRYPAFQDRPHSLSVVLNWQMARRIIATAFWVSHTGSAITTPVGFYEFQGQTVPVYGDRNNDRLPAYHRLDLSFRFILNKRPDAKYQHSLVFSIYNALAHDNVYALRFNKLDQDAPWPSVPGNTLLENALTPSQIDLIRFFPSLTYKFNL